MQSLRCSMYHSKGMGVFLIFLVNLYCLPATTEVYSNKSTLLSAVRQRIKYLLARDCCQHVHEE